MPCQDLNLISSPAPRINDRSCNVTVSYHRRLPRSQYQVAAKLYDQAFGKKMSPAISNKQDRLAIYARGFDGDFAVIAQVNGRLVGLAGYKTPAGSLTGGIKVGSILRRLGFFRGMRAIGILALYDRTAQPNEMVMDGIAVDSNYRGMGIGGSLLRDLIAHAREMGFSSIRLDVIDSNPRAHALYERQGFVATRYEKFPWLRFLLGFSGSTTMVYRL